MELKITKEIVEAAEKKWLSHVYLVVHPCGKSQRAKHFLLGAIFFTCAVTMP